MNPTDFKKLGDIIGDQTTLLRSIKTDIRNINGRLTHVESQLDIIKQEQRETKEELKEVHETTDALLADMIDTQKQIGGIYDELTVVGDKVDGQNQRITHVESKLAIAVE